MLKLHKKDRRILQELDLDARQPTSRIAKKIGLSVGLTNYRIRQLEKRGIIQWYYSLYNVASLGYNLYKVYMKLQNIGKEKEEEFIKYLVSIPEVGLVATSSGNYDLEIGIVGKNLVEFHNVLEAITKNYGIYIKAKDVTTNIEMWQYNRKYLFEGAPRIKEFYYFSREKSKDFDGTDTKILKFLARNGRKNNTAVEEALGISRKVVGYRIKKLMKNNIILGFRPLLDRDLLGLAYFRVLIKLQAIKEERLNELFQYFRTSPHVVYLIKCIGPWELEIEVEIEDGRKCHDMILDIKHNFHDIISDTQIIEIFKDYKYEFVIA